jgi:hypothetical protein
MVFFDNLIDKPVLYVNTAGVGPRKITDELLQWRCFLKWIRSDNVQQRFCLGPKTGCGYTLCIFLRLLGEYNSPPAHQPGSSSQSSTGI